MKSCSRCRVCKPLDEFHRRSATAPVAPPIEKLTVQEAPRVD